MSAARLSGLPALGVAARRGFQRLTPEPFTIAVILSALVLVASAARLGGDADAFAATLGYWHRSAGLWSLLAFGMQARLVLVLGSALDLPLRDRNVLLEAAGFVAVVDQRAGWDGERGPFGEVVTPGWKRAGLPTEEGE